MKNLRIIIEQQKRKYTKSCFTIVELIVSMGIFAILLLVASIIFGTAQKGWTQSTGRMMTFENARLAMNLMTNDLQSILYGGDRTIPFWHKPQSGTNVFSNELLNFVARVYPSPLASNNLCEVKYQLFHNNNLTRADSGWIIKSVTHANASRNRWNFYDNPTVGLTTSNPAVLAFTADNTSSLWGQPLIPFVTDLKFTCYDEEGNVIVGVIDEPTPLPFSIEIELSLLDRDAWQKWVELDSNHGDGESADAQAFRKKNERTFRKTVLIGNRGQYD